MICCTSSYKKIANVANERCERTSYEMHIKQGCKKIYSLRITRIYSEQITVFTLNTTVLILIRECKAKHGKTWYRAKIGLLGYVRICKKGNGYK